MELIEDMNTTNPVDSLSTSEYVSSLSKTETTRYMVREDGTVEFIKS